MTSPERHKILGAVYLILQRDDEVLLLRRFNTGWQDGNYSLVSGHIDGDEPFTLAMLREAKEEAGIDIAEQAIRFAHAMHRSDPSDDREYIDIYFVANAWEGEVTNMEPEKCDELKWYPLDNLPDNIINSVKTALVHYRDGVPYSEYGWQP
jgi:8-oxo-dGTP diphosphatase